MKGIRTVSSLTSCGSVAALRTSPVGWGWGWEWGWEWNDQSRGVVSCDYIQLATHGNPDWTNQEEVWCHVTTATHSNPDWTNQEEVWCHVTHVTTATHGNPDWPYTQAVRTVSSASRAAVMCGACFPPFSGISKWYMFLKLPTCGCKYQLP